jgi:MFS superfamily sulfate permease-like transporter
LRVLHHEQFHALQDPLAPPVCGLAGDQAGRRSAGGLYAAIIPLAVFALLASSRHLVTSPDDSMATLVGAAIFTFAVSCGARLKLAG